MSVGSPVGTTSLPGVRLWLRRLLDDLRAGRSCLWLVPDAQIGHQGVGAEALMDELLHELGDFLLVAPGEAGADPGEAPALAGPASVPALAPTVWGGADALLDYDDGLAGFGSAPRAPAAAEDRVVPPPVRADADLLGRLAKELPAMPREAAGEPEDRMEEILSRLTGGGPGTAAETRVIVVRAWHEAVSTVATDLLRRLSAAVKEAGLPPGARPRLLVLATYSALPPELPDQMARENIGVHWWWGAVGRLDTATVVSTARPSRPGPAAHRRLLEFVTQATIVEVCGPFLDVAAELAAGWDGVPESLPEALLRAVGAAGPGADTASGSASASGGVGYPVLGRSDRAGSSVQQPDMAIRPAWNAGQVDAWDGQLRYDPRRELGREHEDTLRKRVWLAQNRALLPLLDDAREDFTEVIRVRSRLPLAQLAERYRSRPVGGVVVPVAESTARGLSGLELGAMWGAHVNADVSLKRTEAERLRVFWDARNRLAHRTPLDAPRLDRLARALSH